MLGLRRYKKTQIDLWQGDITTFVSDAIVNEIAKVTVTGDQFNCIVQPAGSLPAVWAIQAAGPQFINDQVSAPLLRLYFESILATGLTLKVRHLTIPIALATGLGFSTETAASCAFTATKSWLNQHAAHLDKSVLKRLTFVAIDGKIYDILQQTLFAEFSDDE